MLSCILYLSSGDVRDKFLKFCLAVLFTYKWKYLNPCRPIFRLVVCRYYSFYPASRTKVLLGLSCDRWYLITDCHKGPSCEGATVLKTGVIASSTFFTYSLRQQARLRQCVLYMRAHVWASCCVTDGHFSQGCIKAVTVYFVVAFSSP